ncbi:MAG TPA: hypothetical protein VN802_13630 [Stellaceae bacterium]|nr:hypothetical protein [Stellaceae bacterium]
MTPPYGWSDQRVRRLLPRMIDRFKLSLDGMVVYTEAASGAYLGTPVLAALAGAARVIAETRDSAYGSVRAVADATLKLATRLGVEDRIEIVDRRRHDLLAESDIVTNSGFVRPIDRDLIDALKPTAVIPLMWETWEFVESQFDLAACKSSGILVLGTNEHRPPCDMVPYCGLLGLKLLFELGLEGHDCDVLVLGNPPYPGGALVEFLRRAGIAVTWFSGEDGGDFRYSDLAGFFESDGKRFDAILVCDHAHPNCLLGARGYLTFELIKRVNPDIAIGIVTGAIDVEGLAESGIAYLPRSVQPFGLMSYQPYHLGPYPVLLLYAAGLKVGEAMAKARRRGLPVAEAAADALASSPAMDFEGARAWLSTRT